MPRLRYQRHSSRRDLTASVGLFLAYCSLARAARRCHALHRPGPAVVGFVLPEDADAGFYESAAKELAYRHSRSDGLGRRDTVVLAASRNARTGRVDRVDFTEAVRDFARVVIVAESREALPEGFDLVADATVDVGPDACRTVL